MVSGTHWGAWTISPRDKSELPYGYTGPILNQLLHLGPRAQAEVGSKNSTVDSTVQPENPSSLDS